MASLPGLNAGPGPAPTMATQQTTPLTLSGMLRHAVCGMMILLTACAPVARLPEIKPDVLWQSHLAQVSALDSWTWAGRVVVREQGRGFSAGMRWRQRPDGTVLRLSAPLAQGIWQLTVVPGIAQVIDPKGQQLEAENAETLLRQAMGWSLPVAGARYWVAGIPDPALPVNAQVMDDSGRMTSFQQDGWTVDGIEYMEVDGISLPRRVHLSRAELDVKLAINRWELQSL